MKSKKMPPVLSISNAFRDHLYRGSFYLVLSRLLNAAAGFLFWVIAAKLYPIAEVGRATELISSLGLIMIFSKLGFDYSLIRYAESADRNQVFSTSLVITSAASAVISVVYILLFGFFQKDLAFSPIYGILFILISLFNSIALISGNMFLALRKGQYFFIQTALISLRLFLLFPLTNLKGFGILLSLGICYAFSAFFSLWALWKEVKIFPGIDRSFIKLSLKYSIESYFSSILAEAPILILPIMVLHLISQEAAAIYYIAMSIGNLVLIVPNALSLSLFVEGSRGQPLRQNIMKACSVAYLFLIPITVIAGIWGRNILGLICKEYIEAYDLLLLVIITSFFLVIYMVFISVKNVKMQTDWSLKFNLLRFFLIIGASCLLIPVYNITGVGYSWLSAHVILTLVIVLASLKTGVIRRFRSRENGSDFSGCGRNLISKRSVFCGKPIWNAVKKFCENPLEGGHLFDYACF
jgi:O-antigen/teichoic acid export membrane protein